MWRIVIPGSGTDCSGGAGTHSEQHHKKTSSRPTDHYCPTNQPILQTQFKILSGLCSLNALSGCSVTTWSHSLARTAQLSTSTLRQAEYTYLSPMQSLNDIYMLQWRLRWCYEGMSVSCGACETWSCGAQLLMRQGTETPSETNHLQQDTKPMHC